MSFGKLNEPKKIVAVYDLLNAGPRRRFTVEGKLVSNCYGLSYHSLTELFGEEKAARIWPILRARYRVLMRYTNAVHVATAELGYSTTLAGRRRRLPLITSGDAYQRGHAARQAFNTKMQGSAADLVKLAQVILWKKVPEFQQVLQVHDELIGEVEGTEKQIKEVAMEVKKVMEGPWKLEVPLLCEPKVCNHWREGKG